MTSVLEFPYRHKAKVVFWLLTVFIVCLGCLAGIAYVLFAGELSPSDFPGQRGGTDWLRYHSRPYSSC